MKGGVRMNEKLNSIAKWSFVFGLSLGIILVAMFASLCSIASIMGAYELVQGNVADPLMMIVVFAMPIGAFLGFKLLGHLTGKVKKIAKLPV